MTWHQWLLLLGIMTAYVTALSWFWEAYFVRRAKEEVGEYDSSTQ